MLGDELCIAEQIDGESHAGTSGRRRGIEAGT